MKLTLTALFDDETRKQVREEVLGEARKIARSVIDLEVGAEVKRLGQNLQTRILGNDYQAHLRLKEVVKDVITAHWEPTVKPMLEELIKALAEKAVDRLVAKKLADKTVWEASKQELYVRQIARDEMVKAVGRLSGE
jgi:hypothetical protein